MRRTLWPWLALGLFALPTLARGQDAAAPAPTAATPSAEEVAPGDPLPTPAAAQAEPSASFGEGAPEAGAELEPLTEAELAAMGLSPGSGGVDKSFHFSGFSDFTAYIPIKPKGLPYLAVPSHPSFYVGNLNLYLSKNLSDRFRTMGEVRFTYLPNGSPEISALSATYVDTSVLDYADNSRKVRWGGVIIQRAYLEWTLHELAILRMGQYLTPYGIWNVDHGSPAYIPVQRPYGITNNWFPQQQTGLELYGRYAFNGRTAFGYHVTLSNGRGSIAEYRDLDDNKAVGGRVYLDFQAAGHLRIGASGYYGRNTSAAPEITLDDNGVLVAGENITQQFDELNIAADIRYKHRWVTLQAEWMSHQRRYTDAGRLYHTIPLSPFGAGFARDSLSWSGYGLFGLELPWYALMPYVMVQYSDEIKSGAETPDTRLELLSTQAGLNVHPIDAVVFKVEYTHSRFLRKTVYFDYPINTLQLQAAWAF